MCGHGDIEWFRAPPRLDTSAASRCVARGSGDALPDVALDLAGEVGRVPLLEPIAFVLTEAFSGATAGEGPSLGALAVDSRSSRSRLRVIRRVRRTAGLFLRASGFPRRAPGLGGSAFAAS